MILCPYLQPLPTYGPTHQNNPELLQVPADSDSDISWEKLHHHIPTSNRSIQFEQFILHVYVIQKKGCIITMNVLIVYIIYLFSELLGNFMKKWDFNLNFDVM